MRHVITGGSGFTGRYLCEALIARGERPLVIDVVEPSPQLRDKVDYVAADVAVVGALPPLGPDDVVYHLAARQFADGVPRFGREQWFDAVNVRGTELVLAAMAAGGAGKLVFFSSDMTYGLPQANPLPVIHPQVPIGPYGRSKLQAELLVMAQMASGALDATIFRPRLIAGAGRLGILARLFTLIRLGLPVPMIGGGRNRYQMIAVQDCVAAALRAVELGCPAGPFNLGSEAPPEVRELLGQLCRRAGSRSVVLPLPARPLKAALAGLDRIGMPLLYPEQFAIADADYLLDTSLTGAALDWRPALRDEDILLAAYSAFVEQ